MLRGELVAKWDVRRKALTTQRRDVASLVRAYLHVREYTTLLLRYCSPREVLMASAFIKRRLRTLQYWLYYRYITPCISSDPITVTLDAMVEGGDPMMHGHISEPGMQPWQGHPSRKVSIWVVGGLGPQLESLPVVQYEPVSDTWVTSTIEPIDPTCSTQRYLLQCAVLDNRLYAIGGNSYDARRASPMVTLLDPDTHTWDAHSCAPMENPRRRFACVTVGDHIYAIGGHIISGDPVQAEDDGRSVERYDPGTNRWEARASMIRSRSGMACAVLHGDIYATGGLSFEEGVDEPGRDNSVSVERYDTGCNRWEPVPNMPVGRHYHAAATLGDRLYVIGGRSDLDDYNASVDRFDPTRNQWEPVAPLAVARFNLAAVTAGNYIYAIGGFMRIPSEMKEVEVYDPKNNTWAPCAPMPHGREGMSAVVWPQS